MSSRILGIAAALIFLLGAAGVAVYVATRPEPLLQAKAPAPNSAPSPAVNAPSASSGPVEEIARLSAAMKTCENDAAKDTRRLHMLVTPLSTEPKHMEDWKLIAINQLGNAVAIGSQDVLAGLKAGTLSIGRATYGFALRDDTSKREQRWDAQTGMQRLSVADDGAIQVFRLQYTGPGKTGTEDWGRPVQRQAGQCHWINVLPLP